MTESRWTHARSWLLASVLTNGAASLLGFATRRLGEPVWLDVVRAVLLVTALVCLAVAITKSVRWRAAEGHGAEHSDQ